MKMTFIRFCLMTAAAGLALASVPALAVEHSVMPKAKIGMAEARRIAVKAFPRGKIMKEELEREGGGSGLRYSFDMKRGGAWREVGVDAMSGKVLENRPESANPKD